MNKRIFLFLFLINLVFPILLSFYCAIEKEISNKKTIVFSIYSEEEEEEKEESSKKEKEENEKDKKNPLMICLPTFFSSFSKNKFTSAKDDKELSSKGDLTTPPPKNI